LHSLQTESIAAVARETNERRRVRGSPRSHQVAQALSSFYAAGADSYSAVPVTVEPLPSRISRRVISFALIRRSARAAGWESANARRNARFPERDAARIRQLLGTPRRSDTMIYENANAIKIFKKFLPIFIGSFIISQLNS